MPVFNAERYLDDAIVSVLADDYDRFELVAVDDGSVDGTSEILRRWAERDPRVVVHRQENRGIAEALNVGMAMARGEYIARLDADDLHVSRLRRQVAVLDREPHVVLVSTWFDLIDDRGRLTGGYHVSEPPEVTRWLLNFHNVIGGHAQVMFRRAAALEAGGYRLAFSIAEDYDLWTRLRGGIVVLSFVGLKRRRHASAASVSQRDRQQRSSRNVMRRTLSAYLQRDITEREVAAVVTLWRGGFDLQSIDAAEPICREAYTRFASEHPSPRLHRRLRFLIGRHWSLLAARCLWRRRPVAALASAARGLVWHPLGLGAAAVAALTWGFRRLGRAFD
jgi:glycosyltransferase involved in cell wall biosynthesis